MHGEIEGSVYFNVGRFVMGKGGETARKEGESSGAFGDSSQA